MNHWTLETPKEDGYYWFTSRYENHWFEPELCKLYTETKQVKVGEDYFDLAEDVVEPMFYTEKISVPPLPL